MGVTHTFLRVKLAELQGTVLPAFARAAETGQIEPLLPLIDVAGISHEWGAPPTVELRTSGLFRKSRIASFQPPPGVLLESAVARRLQGEIHDCDKLLTHLRSRSDLLSPAQWRSWDTFLDWAHNLPELFRGHEGPFGLLLREECLELAALLEDMSAKLNERERAEAATLKAYLDATPQDCGVLVKSG
jgi:hypothetical protein